MNPSYSTSPGNATTDKIFLLSITEAKKYFSSDDDRKALNSTRYTGTYLSWWLRSPGDTYTDYDIYNAAYVKTDGSVSDYGYDVNYGSGVRPALWVKY